MWYFLQQGVMVPQCYASKPRRPDVDSESVEHLRRCFVVSASSASSAVIVSAQADEHEADHQPAERARDELPRGRPGRQAWSDVTRRSAPCRGRRSRRTPCSPRDGRQRRGRSARHSDADRAPGNERSRYRGRIGARDGGRQPSSLVESHRRDRRTSGAPRRSPLHRTGAPGPHRLRRPGSGKRRRDRARLRSGWRVGNDRGRGMRGSVRVESPAWIDGQFASPPDCGGGVIR